MRLSSRQAVAYCIEIGNVQIGNIQIGNDKIGNDKIGNAVIGRMEWPFSATDVRDPTDITEPPRRDTNTND